MKERPRHVLFLCTGNSARSILAEAILARRGGGRFAAHSAGSHPKGQVHPFALALLAERGYDTASLRSKGWEELATPDAPPLDFVFTVCDAAAGETCPVWPGRPVTAHWGIADPAACEGSEDAQRRAFERAFVELDRRIALFLALPLDSLDRLALRSRLEAIGEPAAEEPAGS